MYNRDRGYKLRVSSLEFRVVRPPQSVARAQLEGDKFRVTSFGFRVVRPPQSELERNSKL